MNKFLKGGMCIGMCALLAVPVAGCGGSDYDTETRPLTMAIGALDGNFNPFFYTAVNDGSVASMTQVSMLATDANGDLICGEDVPTVAKAYTVTESSDSSSQTKTKTTYRFLIKNGMKFSDGVDLTVMDVLFSLYVNLDVAYTGSATIYSSDIKGLNAYQAQDPNLGDYDTNDYSSTYYNEAQQRIDNIIAACNGTGSKTQQVLDDIETVKELFLEEVTSDWTSVESSFTSAYTDESFEYNFGEGDTWKYYYLNEGLISAYTYYNSNGGISKVKENGKYVTTLEEYTGSENVLENMSDLAEEMENAISDESNIQKAMETYGTTNREEAIEYVKKDTAIQTVYENYTTSGSETNYKGIANIVQYWETANTALEKFAGEARTAAYEEMKKNNGGELLVSSISGITVERVTQWTGSDGVTINLDDEYDVLQIVINDIDPKAIYNFAFTVCPMHYYSDEEHTSAAMADYAEYLKSGDSDDITHFGVETGDSTWYDDEVQDSEKNRNPVGAGPYATSNQNGTAGTAGTFYSNKYVYYMRNEYFYTMGEGIENAKIKYMQYREMGDDKVLNALINQEVDYGMPSATSENQTQLSAYSSYLNAETLYDTSGYGYIGINPKFVPDHQVRQAIMKAMNTALAVSDYYTREFASTIYRPMSKTSWVYDYDDGSLSTEYSSIKYTTQTKDIIALVESAGWYDDDGDGIRENADGDQLKFTFTIAGESTDHPAFKIFTEAEKLLEQCGFSITVATNVNALKELASGNLAVWAAAWSSAIDPDMYQVYHKDSTASSVKNWNYSEILKNTNGDWDYEYDIVMELSDIIDDARTTNTRSKRAAYYIDALDLVMDLAVELPTYQRKDNEVFNKTVINRDSLTAVPSTYVSLFDRIWEVDYN